MAFLLTISGALKSRPVLWPLVLLGLVGSAIVVWLWTGGKRSTQRTLSLALASVLALSPFIGMLAAATPQALSHRFFADPAPPASEEALEGGLPAADPSDTVDPDEQEVWPSWEEDVRLAQARCDAVDASLPVSVEKVSITELLGPVAVDYLRFSNSEVLSGRTLSVESFGRTGLVAAMERGERYFTEFYTFDLDDPVRLEKVGTLTQQAVLDLLRHPETGELLFSWVPREDGCLSVGLSAIPFDSGEILETDQTRIFRTQPCLPPFPTWPDGSWRVQNGGRIVLLDDREVLLSVGDFRLAPSSLDEQVVTPLTDELDGPLGYGANHRIDLESGEARDFTVGHRNPQGLVRDSETGNIFLSEHGPNAGDEINLLREGGDHGWRSETYGKPYGGFEPLSDEQFRREYFAAVGPDGLDRWCNHSASTPPMALLSSSSGTAPSAMLVLNGWGPSSASKKLVLATLANRSLWAFELSGEELFHPRRAVLDERIRDLHETATGALLVAGDGGVLMVISQRR